MADGAAFAPAVSTTCPYCGVGCGISARASGARTLTMSGDLKHPANAGKLCSKGTALADTVSLEGRLLYPLIAGARVSWDEAIRHVAHRFEATIAEHGPEAVAFYVSGQLLTEDYYAANKLMKGFIGAANIDTNSRLCMASAVAAHNAAFGADLVPGCYEDLERADLIVSTGHNCAWTHPILFRRIEAARAAKGQKLVVIDPRRTDTAQAADLHLPIAPQSDVRLWNGLLAHLIAHGCVDEAYVAAHVEGFDAAKAVLARDDHSAAAIAADCDVPAEDIARFFALFAKHARTVTMFSMGVNQSAQGVNKALAIINAHLATGRIGKPGAAPFSITGQPNAMGGRETGGLASMLAAHMGFSATDRDRVRRFWNAPNLAPKPGLKAVDMFEAVHDGRIKALWVMATNPAVSMPDANRVRQALARCPFVVVSECMARTDTTQFADVMLPASAWGERDGTVTNTERRISRQRPMFPAPGEAKPDWRIVADVAAAMGWGEAFAWKTSADVFGEYAALTCFENDGARPLRLKGFEHIAQSAYDAMAPTQWPVHADGAGTARLFEDGRFAHGDGRARMILATPESARTDEAFEFALNTGRVRDHWHTMTRTALSPSLCRHAPEPVLDMHPADARALRIEDGALVRVSTAHGHAILPARLTTGQRRGGLFAPMHWTEAFAPAGRANPLVSQARDPTSGQPEFKHTPARVEPVAIAWRAFVIDRAALTPAALEDVVWRRIPQDACSLVEAAGLAGADPGAFLDAWDDVAGERVTFDDPARGAARRAYFRGGTLMRIVVLTRNGALPPRDWLVARFADDAVAETDRAALLLGRLAHVRDEGPTICACMSVRARTLQDAAAAGAASVEALGAATGAGTQCGSCRIELKRFLTAHEELGDVAA